MPVTKPDPRAIYEERLATHRTLAQSLASRQQLIANLRLASFGLAAGMVWIAARGNPGLIPWLALPAGVFVWLVLLYHRAKDRCNRANRAVQIYERGLANLDGRWMGSGAQGTLFLDPHHPFSEDLDLFGPGSLFERLCTASTPAGKARLAGWLLNPSPIDELVQRQLAVAELATRIDFREELIILSRDLDESIDPVELIRWAESPSVVFPRGAKLIAFVLAMATACLLVGWLCLGWLDARPFLVAALLELILANLLRGRVQKAIAGVEKHAEQLSVLAGLLKRIEAESFAAESLAGLRESLESVGEKPSRRLAKLSSLVDLLEARRNQMFMPVAWVLLWTTQIAIRLEDWRHHSAGSIREWIDVVGRFEALSSLAAFAFENPDDIFPELVTDGPQFAATGLGHPLISAESCIRNDVQLGGSRRVLIISGSNMSGKSTLLRTVGTSVVLALAGATVRAERATVSLLSIGATLRVRDSLQEGHSRFYAELVRLKTLVDIAKGGDSLLFLLDEILHGTNSHDRRIGAEALVLGLVELGAIGLVTTHDLALAEMVAKLGERADNVHFADQLENGRMSFDFKMRPGTVQHSNAIALMRSVGLDVPANAN